MVSQMQRAFAQKLGSNFASPSQSSENPSLPNTGCNNNAPTNSQATASTKLDGVVPTIVEPVDYEQYCHAHRRSSDGNGDAPIEFPEGSEDVDVYVLARKVRTIVPAGPDEDISKLLPHVRDFVRAYSRDWLVVDYVYRQTNAVDDDRSNPLTYEDSWIPSLRNSTHSSRLSSSSSKVATHRNDQHIYSQQSKELKPSIKKATSGSEITLISSYSSGSSNITDLINTANVPLIGTVLQKLPVDAQDRLNATSRQENRQNFLFGPCLPTVKTRQRFNNYIEYRTKPRVPREFISNRRILVKCLQLE